MRKILGFVFLKVRDFFLTLVFSNRCIHCEEKNGANNHFFCQKCLLELSIFFEESLTKSTEHKKFLFPLKGACRNFYHLTAHDGEEMQFLSSFILAALLHQTNPWTDIRDFVLPIKKYSSARWVQKEIKKNYPYAGDAFDQCNLYFTMTAKQYADLEEKKGFKHLVLFLEI